MKFRCIEIGELKLEFTKINHNINKTGAKSYFQIHSVLFSSHFAIDFRKVRLIAKRTFIYILIFYCLNINFSIDMELVIGNDTKKGIHLMAFNVKFLNIFIVYYFTLIIISIIIFHRAEL